MRYFTPGQGDWEYIQELGWQITNELYADAVNIAKEYTGISDDETAAVEGGN